MSRKVRPTGESGFSRDGRLRVCQPVTRPEYLGDGHSFGGWQVIKYCRSRVCVAGFEGGKKRFRLAPEMVEIRTGGKTLFHNTFFITAPGSANGRHAVRAFNRDCE
jgi:hypothetical protein